MLVRVVCCSILLEKVYHICGQMSKVYVYSPIIYDIALFKSFKKLCSERSLNILHVRILLRVRCSHIDMYSHRVTNSKKFYDKM